MRHITHYIWMEFRDAVLFTCRPCRKRALYGTYHTGFAHPLLTALYNQGQPKQTLPTLPLPANHQKSYHGVSPNQGRRHAHLQPPHPVELLQKGCAESRQGHGAHQTQIWTLSILLTSSGTNIPISSILLCKGAGRRKVSSLQDRVSVPTNSEFVANILALSSDRFTPAIDATSLMSSSSLERRGAEDYVV